jgi:hypothetical protein
MVELEARAAKNEAYITKYEADREERAVSRVRRRYLAAYDSYDTRADSAFMNGPWS